MVEKFIHIATGAIAEAAFVNEEQKKFWSSVTVKGIPDKRTRGTSFDARWANYRWWFAEFARIDPSREALAAPIRAKLIELQKQVEATKDELYAIYAGCTWTEARDKENLAG